MTESRPRLGTMSLPDHLESTGEFESLLLYLKHSRGFDFTAYKRSSLIRRVLVRMQALGVKGFAAYLDFLQVDPEEFTRLFNTLLINVTSFFRDTASWDVLRDVVIPRLVGPPNAAGSIRVWSAGCASGEEAYSIAILLAEAIGTSAFRERVKIYATDVDEEALIQARQAIYGPRTAEDVPAPWLEKYFERHEARYAFSKELRRSVIFGRHDLIQDAPISRVDLLICRNCLMYFNSEAQARIVSRFHAALAPAGVLFLGKAETLLAQSAAFEPVDLRRRLFTKADGPREARHLTLAPSNGFDRLRYLREAAQDVSPSAQLVVDGEGTVVQMNQQLRTLFGLSTRDIGRPLKELELSHRPFELRSCIARALADRRPIAGPGGQWTSPGGQPTFLELSVVPLLDPAGAPIGAGVHFIDLSRQRQLQDETHRAGQELETALEQLRSANEELETTNEELQSTVEELETTNEELQSTNEELETMNEELQSTNEELRTINQEARDRDDQLGELNGFLESIRSCLAGDAEVLDVTLPATNYRGHSIQVRLTCTPLTAAPSRDSRGVILIMEELDGRP